MERSSGRADVVDPRAHDQRRRVAHGRRSSSIRATRRRPWRCPGLFAPDGDSPVTGAGTKRRRHRGGRAPVLLLASSRACCGSRTRRRRRRRCGYDRGHSSPRERRSVVRDATLWRLQWSSPGSAGGSGAASAAVRRAKVPGVRRRVDSGGRTAWPAILEAARGRGRGALRSEPRVPGDTSWQVRRFLETQGEALARGDRRAGRAGEWCRRSKRRPRVGTPTSGRRCGSWDSSPAPEEDGADVDLATAQTRCATAHRGYSERRVQLVDFEDASDRRVVRGARARRLHVRTRCGGDGAARRSRRRSRVGGVPRAAAATRSSSSTSPRDGSATNSSKSCWIEPTCARKAPP
jgi:hypothetical protein